MAVAATIHNKNIKKENDEEKPSNSVAVQNRKCFLLSCERIQSVTSTLLRIEWNGNGWCGKCTRATKMNSISIYCDTAFSRQIRFGRARFEAFSPDFPSWAYEYLCYWHVFTSGLSFQAKAFAGIQMCVACIHDTFYALASQSNIFMYLYRLLQLSMNSLDQMKFSCGDKLCVVHPHVINDLHCCTKSFERRFPTNKKKHAQLRLMLSSFSSRVSIFLECDAAYVSVNRWQSWNNPIKRNFNKFPKRTKISLIRQMEPHFIFQR